MNKGTLNNNKKRSHSHEEAHNSFVKNVSSTVSSLLPSSIKKWFSSPSTSNTNGSAQVADATDSSSEDEVPESPTILSQPPTKRMRYNSPGKLNDFGESDVNSTASNVVSLETYSALQSHPSRTTFRREPDYVSTRIHSTVSELTNEKNEQDSTVFKPQHSLTTVGPSVARKRQSLFDMLNNDSSKKASKEAKSSSTAQDPGQPYFKPGLLGSPFYPGKTMYGGAASSYMNSPNIKLCKTTMVNESSSHHDNTMSHSARRVMDLLEHYSSPLSEAKRILNYVGSPRNDNLSKSLESSSLKANRSSAYKTQELHVPSIATILSLKQRSRLMDTTNTARQIIASHSSAANYLPYPKCSIQSESSNKDNGEKLITKVKTRVTRTKRGESSELRNVSTPVKLPTGFLEIDQNNLPKFNFGSPIVSISSTSTVQSTTTPVTETSTSLDFKTTGDLKSVELETQKTNNCYKFSTPVTVSKDMPFSSTIPKFTFDSPMKNIEETVVSKEKDGNIFVSSSQNNDDKVSFEKSKDWKCSDCCVNNKANATNGVCCSAKKKTEENKALLKCSICKSEPINQTNVDKCHNCQRTEKGTNNKLQIVSPSEVSNWKCEDCWVSNEESAEKCVCCGGKNPKLSIPAEKKANKIDSDWKCNDCWINNKSTVDKCVACGGVKPGTSLKGKPVISTIPTSNLLSSSFKPPDSTFQNIVKSQTDKWECSNCLVRNDSDKAKCVCCETEKPGAVKEPKNVSFNFGMNTNTTFKFGIDPKAQEMKSNKEKEIEQKTGQSKSEELEANNNILANTPTFTFGIPAKKIDEKEKPAKDESKKVAEIPKLNFTFGIPKQIANDSSENTNLTQNDKKQDSVINSTEKLQEVPTVVFKLPKSTQDAPKEPANIFTSSVTSAVSNDKSLETIKTEVVPSTIVIEKSLIFTPLIMQTTASSDVKKPSTFSFTGTGLKPATNSFTIPVANAATTSTDVTSLPAPVTTSSSLFQKSDSKTSPAVSLFQKIEAVPSPLNFFKKSDSVTTTANEAPAFTTSTKLFSFGSSNQTALSQPEKPKFSFNFGNTNKADAPSIFNATFGSTTNANTISNTFTLPSANTVQTGPSIPGGSLGSSSGLSTGSSLNSTSLSTNNLLSTGNNGLATGNNGLSTGNQINVSKLGNESLNTGNTLKTTSTLPTTLSNNIFGAVAQNENIWSSTNNTTGNLFVPNATNNNPLQKPASFTFGTSTTFNASNGGSAFGTNNTQTVFPTENQSSLFSNPAQSQATPNIFGSSQQSSSPAPVIGVFGNTITNVVGSNTFLNPSQSQAPGPAPSFNFGAKQLGTGVFGFGQQQQQISQQFQSPVYNFGSSQGTPQFNMGSAPNISARRVRKAVRRTTPR
ncbi:unnamed protein product [Parnassius apollo]|uniref:(apollo) hypothetical protein n=1 Tax=Parnassius apollo TaxID=110799 RepID=A0A8S3XSX7_PARAO|nr:unnamed protein product [Parnassius apollo]